MAEDQPLYCVIFGPKRHAQFTMGALGPELVAHAEVALGGFFADPPSMQGRDGGGPHRRWSTAAVLGEVRVAVARATGMEVLRGVAPWDAADALPFPAIRRLEVKTPKMARLLPAALGARPGTRYVEAIASPLRGEQETPVAIDPGGDLAEWCQLRWFSKQTGERIAITTDPRDVDSVLVESLADRAVRYGRPPRTTPITDVQVTPSLVRHVGRASGVIDAQLDGLDQLGSRRPVFDDVDLGGFVQTEIDFLGPSAFSRRYGVNLKTVEGVVAGRIPSHRTLDKVHRVLTAGEPTVRTCALDGCGTVLTRVNATWCSRSHRERARAGESTTAENSDVVTCSCGATLLGGAARRGTCRSCTEERRDTR
jgi:hypothetical protein